MLDEKTEVRDSLKLPINDIFIVIFVIWAVTLHEKPQATIMEKEIFMSESTPHESYVSKMMTWE